MKFKIDNLQKQIEKWLISGAFLRVSQDEILLYGLTNENDLDENNKVLTISYADFFEIEKLQEKKISIFRMKTQEFLQVLENFIVYKDLNYKNELKNIFWSEPEISQFEKSFQSIQIKIQSAEINKAVPVVFAESKTSMSEEYLLSMLINVLKVPSSAWPYGVWDSEGGVIGATPELLFSLKNQQLKTMALAGTLPKSSGFSPDTLLRDLKELKEHQWVIDDLVEILKNKGELRVGSTGILELPHLYHLKTEIELMIKGEISVRDLISSLHPTPALGVSPRARGLSWLKYLPCQAERSVFGAPICFEVSENEYVCVVAIRNLIWSKEHMRIYTGCGIVSDSQLSKEWVELQNKQKSVRINLGLAINS